MFDKIDVLKKIGWYQNAEVTAHDKLTSLFNCMVEYFKSVDKEHIPQDVYVGGYYPINPQTSFSMVIKRGHKYIEATKQAIHRAYTAYYNFLKSPQAHQIASDTSLFVNGNLEFVLIDEFISKTYGQVL